MAVLDPTTAVRLATESIAVNEERRRGASTDRHGGAARPTIRDSDNNVRIGETVAGPLELSIAGGRVEQCCVDNALSLKLDVSGRWWILRLEGAFALASSVAVEPIQFAEDARASAWAPALDALLQSSITAAHVATDGSLELIFANGCRLDVPVSQQWESWQLSGPEDELIVCGPGGQLSRWPAQAHGGRG